jgi:protein TonB
MLSLFFLISGIYNAPAQQNVAATPTLPAAASGLTDMNYPKEALRLKQEGLSVVRVEVAANGKVETCTVQQSSGSPSLDDATCELFGSIRFKPGRDAQGKAVKAGTSLRMNWRLPRR